MTVSDDDVTRRTLSGYRPRTAGEAADLDRVRALADEVDSQDTGAAVVDSPAQSWTASCSSALGTAVLGFRAAELPACRR